MCQDIDMDADTRTPAEQLGVLIKQSQALLNQRMDEVLRPLGLSVSQYACLQALHDDPGITGSELARRVFVSRQSMNVLVQGLEKRGLVVRSDQPGPRRERATVLTDEASALVARARDAVADVVAMMTRDLAQRDIACLQELLVACCDGLGADPLRES